MKHIIYSFLLMFFSILSCDDASINKKSNITLFVEVPNTILITTDLGEVGPFGKEAAIMVQDYAITPDPENFTVEWNSDNFFPAKKTHLVVYLVVPNTLIMTLDLGTLGPFKKNTVIIARNVEITSGTQYPDVDFNSE